jgi:hypothetical protein
MAIEIKIGASFDDKDIRRAQAELQKLANVTQRAGMSMQQKLAATGKSFSDLGETMSKKVSLPIVAAGALAVKFASDLQESQSKVDVVFGRSADSVTKFGEDAAKSLGMSRAAAYEATGTYGNLLRAMGLSETQSADMSTSLVTLAADLGSFNNVPIEEVFGALRSGLSGETEPLKRFGVNLNQSALKAEALALGLVSTGEEMSAGAKAQAAYSLIMKQTTLAQGDFARTSDGAANSMRIARAQLEDAAAEIGTVLLPAVSKVAAAFGALAGGIGSLPGPIRVAVVAVAGLAAAFGPVVWAIGSVMTSVAKVMAVNWAGMFSTGVEAAKGFASAVAGGMSQALAAVRAMSTGAMLAFGAIGLAVVAAGAALMYFVNQQAKNAQKRFETLNVSVGVLRQSFETLASTGKLTGSLQDITKIMGDLRTEAEQSASTDFFNPGLPGFLSSIDDNANKARESLERWDDALTSVAETDVSMAVSQFNNLKAAGEEMGESLTLEMFPQLKGAIEAAASAAGMSVTDFMNMKNAGGQVKTEFELATKALDDWETEVRSQFDPLFAYGDALDTVRDAQRKQGEAALIALAAVHQHGAGSAEAQLAVGNYQASIRDTTSASFDAAFQLERLREGLQTGAISFGTASAAADGLVAAGLLNEEQARLTKEEWARLSGIVVNTPNSKVIEVSAPGLSAVSEALGNIQTKLGNITSFGGRIKIDVGGNAAGGPVQAGKMGWVGERGRELFIPSTDGVIVPHHESRRMVSEAGSAAPAGGGGSTYNITINGMVGKDKRDILEFLARELPKAAATHSRSFG